jgi:hypothetical protein
VVEAGDMLILPRSGDRRFADTAINSAKSRCGQWWYNLRTQKVEPDEGGPNAEWDRSTRKRSRAPETAAKRTRNGTPARTSGTVNTDGVIGVEVRRDDN